MTNLSTDILKSARALIEAPEAWTTHAAARGEDGRWANPTGPTARQWCALGAITRAVEDVGESVLSEEQAVTALSTAIDPTSGHVPYSFVQSWNDDRMRSHSDAFGRYCRVRQSDRTGCQNPVNPLTNIRGVATLPERSTNGR